MRSVDAKAGAPQLKGLHNYEAKPVTDSLTKPSRTYRTAKLVKGSIIEKLHQNKSGRNCKTAYKMIRD